MKRRSKTIAQQCRYYEVDNIFEYMVSVYLNGNISAFGELYKELNRKDRKEFILYYCCPVNLQTAQESFPKPFRIGLRAFILRKQAP